jgi:hypothetical protein
LCPLGELPIMTAFSAHGKQRPSLAPGGRCGETGSGIGKPAEEDRMMTRLKSAVLLATFASLALGACQSAEYVSPETEAVAAPEPTRGKLAYLPYRLDMTFSPAASTALQRRGDQVIIAAVYYGAPRPGMRAAPPGVVLNEEIHAIEARNGAVKMQGAFDLDLATAATIGEPRVRVIAATALTGIPETLLACDTFDEALPLAVETGGTIHCELAGK